MQVKNITNMSSRANGCLSWGRSQLYLWWWDPSFERRAGWRPFRVYAELREVMGKACWPHFESELKKCFGGDLTWFSDTLIAHRQRPNRWCHSSWNRASWYCAAWFCCRGGCQSWYSGHVRNRSPWCCWIYHEHRENWLCDGLHDKDVHHQANRLS